jgi:hypothetical protein
MTIARMNRASTPDEAETLRIEALMSAISSGELLAPQPLLTHDCCMMGMLAVNIWSKVTHEACEGQPAATVPLPEYILYAVEAMAVEEGAEVPAAEVPAAEVWDWDEVAAVETAEDAFVVATEDFAAEDGVMELELQPAAIQYAYPIL